MALALEWIRHQNSGLGLVRPAGRPTAMDANHHAMDPTLEQGSEGEAQNLQGQVQIQTAMRIKRP